MDLAFKPADPVSLPIKNSQKRFPVRRIYCIGRNYANHITEMGGDASRSEPIFFAKAAETIAQNGQDIPYPPNTKDLQHEIELVVAMGPDGIFGYAVGIDMTRRDLQASAKKKGAPWDRAKNFTLSAPCSAITPAGSFDPTGKHIVLRKNGEIVQSSSLDHMIWKVDEIIKNLSADMDLQPGDLIFTGTPEGVGPVEIGDALSGGIEGLASISVHIANPR